MSSVALCIVRGRHNVKDNDCRYPLIASLGVMLPGPLEWPSLSVGVPLLSAWVLWLPIIINNVIIIIIINAPLPVSLTFTSCFILNFNRCKASIINLISLVIIIPISKHYRALMQHVSYNNEYIYI